MDSPGRTCSDLIGLIKSWINWHSEPAHVSRDFWMPDKSCRVCYECDSQFTLFNRRHHCRLCGRIFCTKCTSNWIPAQSFEHKYHLEDWDKIRVCNYCFRQWEQNLAVPADNGVQVANLDLIGTPSATSSVITKSSGTCDNSSVTLVSLSQSAGLSPLQSTVMETNIDTQSVVTVTSVDIAVDTEEQNHSQKQFEFCLASYNEDEEFGESFLDSKRTPYSSDTSYFNHAKLDEIDDGYRSRKVHPGGDATQNSNNSSVNDSFNSQLLEEIQQIVQKSDENDVSDECEAPSSIYVASDVEIDPVDFEKNGVIWLPPEPEDEEDEREALLFDDDDDVDASGEWGYLRKSDSFGSGEFRNRDKSNEEHKNAMKSVVDTHFRALVAQLLQMENLLVENENDKENWLEIITALSWEAATLLKPDTSKGGQMDPGNYVKVKCLASGHRSDSMVIKGVVCKKNVAHRRMMSKVEKPRVLILGGALEYQRVSNALSSFDTLLQQEMDHLKMAVAKIDAHHPNILIVEKSVSRHAQEYLLAKDISLILNIKRPLLERIARCTGSQIVPSIDHLSSQKLGYCEMFHVEKFLEEHGTAGQGGKKLTKTLMYFEGCPKPLGCTILLRGANGDELKKVKHVVQYGIFAAYHLALETSFLADEGASLPEFPLNNPITVALPDKPSKIDRSISTIPGFTVPDDEKTPGPESVGEPQRSRSAPASDLVKATEASISGNEILGKSTLDSMTSLEIPSLSSADVFQNSSLNVLSPSYSLKVTEVQGSAHSGELGTLEAENMVASGDRHIDNDFGDSNVKIIRSDSHDLDANMNVPNFSLPLLDEKQNLEMKSSLKDDFPPSPSDHQSILVSLSSRCVWKGTVCERSHLFRIKYYGNFDKPLGRFLRDNLFDQNYRCQSCEMPAEAHIQCYTHRQGTLTISVKKLSEVLLPGEKDGKIWMWHRCLKCPRVNRFPPATRRVVMSDAAWGLSFGKFLELSFSNHAAASRTASCGHSLHRDCLRFYGFGKMVACFRYASIDVHSVYLPPSKLDFSYERQEWIQKELNEVMNWADLLFSEVLNALLLLVERKSVSANGTKTPQTRRQMADLEAMLQKEKKEFEESLQMILNQGATKGKPDVDILELNRLRRQLIFQSYVWDHRLLYADRLDDNSELHGISITSSESIKKAIAATEKVSLVVNDSVKTGETLIDSGFLDASAKHNKVPDEGLSHVQSVQNNEVLHQRNDEAPGSNCGDKSSLLLCAEPKSTADSNTVESDITNGTVLCDGQTSICLSDTLDAAWTGENLQGSDILSSVGVTEKFEVEDRGGKDLNNFSSFDETEDGSIWLGMTFLTFYRSLNKNLLGTGQKLDKILEYDPTYMSLFRESKLPYGPRFFLPVGVNDIVVPVYDDEPTSIISYGLASPEYLSQLSDEFEKPRDITDSLLSMQSFDAANFRSFHSIDEIMLESSRTLGSGDESVLSLTSSRSSLPPLDPLSYSKSVHPRVSFANDGPLGKIKYSVTCYYAKRFEALRRICCPSEVDFIRSLSRCKKWGAQGGKSNVFFAKTLDDRFIIKQVTKTELESFIKFAPGYFKYISESIGTGSPTCLAKILGIYQVAIKHVKGGKESKIDLLVMENLLFGRNITRLYDLKGSSRSRYNPDSTGSNKVLLDQNLIETMPTSPIFVGNKAKRLLERAIWNDTAFLASIDVMDYSLLVGIDEEKHELVVGIIDFMRQYTWDKHLETWVKASGILGGNTSASPTVISPKQYKKRFRKAMTTYFLMVPDQWSPPTIIPSKSETDLFVEENNNRESSVIAE